MNEFEIINRYFKKLTKNNPASFNLSDDIFYDKSKKLAVSIDTYNENVHYLNTNFPSLLIKKIIRSSISDLICKGIKPSYIFLSGSGDAKLFNKNKLNKISKSIKEELLKYNLKLSGGDTTYAKNSSFSVTSIGFGNKIIPRNKAKYNDDIYVTNNIGDAFIGLNILNNKFNINKKINNYFINKYYLPDLPIKFIKDISKYANTSIDISDGIFSDLEKMIINQKFGFIIDINKIPISKNLKNLISKKKLNLENIISNGDDFQTLFTSSLKNRGKILSIAKRINLKITRIGSINKNPNKKVILKGQKVLKLLNNKGYYHKF